MDILAEIDRGKGLLAYILLEYKTAQEENCTVQVWTVEIRDSEERGNVLIALLRKEL